MWRRSLAQIADDTYRETTETVGELMQAKRVNWTPERLEAWGVLAIFLAILLALADLLFKN